MNRVQRIVVILSLLLTVSLPSLSNTNDKQQICEDYKVLIELEQQRLELAKAGKPPPITSNEKLSSVFRVLGLIEKLGEEKFNAVVQQCWN